MKLRKPANVCIQFLSFVMGKIKIMTRPCLQMVIQKNRIENVYINIFPIYKY